jgi:Ferritin-like domain
MAPNIEKLLEFDRDGALAEAAGRLAEPGGTTRGTLFRRTGALLAGGAAAALLPAGIASAATPKGDIAILNYALTLEYLEAAFYQRAVDMGALRGEYKRFAKIVAQHEAAHVAALKKALGAKAVKRPSFDFQGTTGDQAKFAQTAITLEDTGVEAYQGQAGNIKTPAILKAAISIHPVEARHAAWIRSIVGHGSGNPSPAPDAFNAAADMDTVLAAVKQTGFIVMPSARASAAASGDPAMTG